MITNTTLNSIAEYRQSAKRLLPRQVFDYIEGGAGEEDCVARNRNAFANFQLTPRVLRNTLNCNTETSILGTSFSAPLIIGPTGLNGVIRPDGDVLLAKAASRAGVPFVLSTPASSSIEDLAKKADGSLWFQLYPLATDLTRHLVNRARVNNYSALIITVDCAIGGKRDRDIRNKFVIPPERSLCTFRNFIRYPAWTYRQVMAPPITFANLTDEGIRYGQADASLADRRMDRNFTRESLRMLRDSWPHKLIIKGVLHSDDAHECAALGADAVVLSNHGGRQLDSAPVPLEVLRYLPQYFPIPRFIDGGFTRGDDVLKALALGASAVVLGRAPLYGLAVDGIHGAYEVINTIKSEMLRSLILLGCSRCSDLNRTFIRDRYLEQTIT